MLTITVILVNGSLWRAMSLGGGNVAFDRSLGPTPHRRIGDNAVGMPLADLFASQAPLMSRRTHGCRRQQNRSQPGPTAIR